MIEDIWVDVNIDNPMSKKRAELNYPTIKPEELLQRIVSASCPADGIVLDCFCGSGTTAAVAEKLGRRWIAMDCGKLSVYTTQKRLFSLASSVGVSKKDSRAEPRRIADWSEHIKKAPCVFLVTEKARRGECDITLDLLHDLSELVQKHKIAKPDRAISLACPEAKLKIPDDDFDEPEDGPGSKRIVVNDTEFRISLIAPKEKPPKDEPLPVKEFALFRAGLYDMEVIKELAWEDYRPFVLKLFGVREESHERYGFALDGHLRTHSALVWNYPEHRDLTLDHGYVEDLHKMIRGRKGERFYVIAPVVAMDFAEDEIVHDGATYVFLKVPLSVLLRLMQGNQAGALKQPMKEDDVNEVIDAVGFDFISQPLVKHKAKKKKRRGEMFPDYVIDVTEFRSQTLTTDPEDFRNFETLSMVMIDPDYDGDVFRLQTVLWGEELVSEAGGLDEAKRIEIRIEEADFPGERMMVILCDRYGNEKNLVFEKSDF